jgi:oligopeptidase A
MMPPAATAGVAMTDRPDTPPLAAGEFADFGALQPDQAIAALEALLASNRAAIEALLAGLPEAPAWDDLVAPLEELDDRLEQAWSPVSHLNGVTNTPEWRAAYEAALPKLTAYTTELGQNRRLFEGYRALADSPAYVALDEPRRRAVDNALRDFRLSGVALEGEARARYGAIKQRLAELATQFSNNLLDATQGWTRQVDDANLLAGIPDSALALYRDVAQARGVEGYVITLEAPAYLPVMQYADDRALRQELYTAYVTRASDQGPNAGQWDNSALMAEILALRHELAALLGFANYAELSLATKMAETPQAVLGFLEDLASHSLPLARREYEELQAFAREQLGLTELAAWDVPYASEKLRQARYAISQEALRPYFPASKVVEGLFGVVEKLFGVRFEPEPGIPVWHTDVQVFRLSRGGETLAWCYLDLYARKGKRGGAWMDVSRSRRRRRDGSLQLPVAFLTCNFTPPSGGLPALLTHDEVTTLFHEFGHGLHHMLTRIEVLPVAGINGVPWDAVELPSQFLENWCWEPEAIPLISGHHESGEPLPPALLEKMLAAKNFQAGLFMLRQLEFALFDFRLHLHYDPAAPRAVLDVLAEVRGQVAVWQPPPFNRFPHSFSHIFAGGYAAGYYSYKWAEVLSADAFASFEEEGIFNRGTGERFLHTILEQGGAREPMALFESFRGRRPTVDALLRHSGISLEVA